MVVSYKSGRVRSNESVIVGSRIMYMESRRTSFPCGSTYRKLAPSRPWTVSRLERSGPLN